MPSPVAEAVAGAEPCCGGTRWVPLGSPQGSPSLMAAASLARAALSQEGGVGGAVQGETGQPRERAVAHSGLPAGKGTRCSSPSGTSVGDRTREAAQRPIPPCPRC